MIRITYFTFTFLVFVCTAGLLAESNHVLIGSPAPLDKITDYQENPVSPDLWQNKCLAVILWTPNIPESSELMSHFQDMSLRYSSKGIVFIALDIKGNEAARDKFNAIHKLSFPQYKLEAQDAITQWKVRNIPAVFLIDKTGKIFDYLDNKQNGIRSFLETKLINLLNQPK